MLTVRKKMTMAAPALRHSHGEREIGEETTRAEKTRMACTKRQAENVSAVAAEERQRQPEIGQS